MFSRGVYYNAKTVAGPRAVRPAEQDTVGHRVQLCLITKKSLLKCLVGKPNYNAKRSLRSPRAVRPG